MRGWAVSLVAMTWLFSADAAVACAMFGGKAGKSPLDESPLETRKPVRSDEARLADGFGMRVHPLFKDRRMHAGIDWVAPLGSPVIAAAGGLVVSAAASGELGNTVLIDHGAGWQTLYAHLASFDVREGDCVAFGSLLGKVGSTGLSLGPALHFEVRWGGRPIDPLRAPVKERQR